MKTCKEDSCNNNRFSAGYCLYHHKKMFPDKYTIKNKTVLNKGKIALKRKPINKISNSMKEKLKLYRIVRKEYMTEHNICEFPGCSSNNISLHHMAGRCGKLLYDKKYFKSLCIPHHNYVEENVDIAISMGLSSKRLNKNDN